jgi:hypothetical protein
MECEGEKSRDLSHREENSNSEDMTNGSTESESCVEGGVKQPWPPPWRWWQGYFSAKLDSCLQISGEVVKLLSHRIWDQWSQRIGIQDVSTPDPGGGTPPEYEEGEADGSKEGLVAVTQDRVQAKLERPQREAKQWGCIINMLWSYCT